MWIFSFQTVVSFSFGKWSYLIRMVYLSNCIECNSLLPLEKLWLFFKCWCVDHSNQMHFMPINIHFCTYCHSIEFFVLLFDFIANVFLSSFFFDHHFCSFNFFRLFFGLFARTLSINCMQFQPNFFPSSFKSIYHKLGTNIHNTLFGLFTQKFNCVIHNCNFTTIKLSEYFCWS